MGSADWMNRNIYGRIEVCFPIYDPVLKTRLIAILNIQLADNIQAVSLNEELQNNYITNGQQEPVRSQEAIYKLLATDIKH